MGFPAPKPKHVGEISVLCDSAPTVNKCCKFQPLAAYRSGDIGLQTWTLWLYTLHTTQHGLCTWKIVTWSTHFAQLTAVRPYTLQWASISLSKFPLPMGGFRPHLIWFLGPIQAHNPNGISISSAAFAGLVTVTDRQTDYTTQSVTLGHIYICSTAGWALVLTLIPN